MANNRMYLKCTKCISTRENPVGDRILLATYYPSSNWYFFLPSKRPTQINPNNVSEMLANVQANMQDLEDREIEFNAFFDKHRHEEDNNYDYNNGGKNFIIEFEC